MTSDRTPRRLRVWPALVVICAALGFIAPKASAQSYVYGRLDLDVPNVSVGVNLTGDFNGDGRPDLALLSEPGCGYDQNCPDGSISVFLGQLNGTFGPAINTTIGVNPSQFVAADFNGDGRLDLAVIYSGSAYLSNSGATVDVFLGNGDGTFQPALTYAAGRGTSSIVAADFNGDGKPDLAVANSLDGTTSILLGNGDGTFQPQVAYPASGASSVTAGDFNGDGKPDLATTTYINNSMAVNVLINNGDGTFGAPVSYAVTDVGYYIASADLYGTGVLDLVITGDSPNGMTVLAGNGDGTFQVGPLTELSGISGPPTIADFNGDGKPDIAVLEYSATVLGGTNLEIFLTDGPSVVGYTVQSSASLSASAADFNGDGKTDLAVSTLEGVAVLTGHGDGTFASTPSTYASGKTGLVQGNPGQVVADFNNDGKLDFALSGGMNISVLLGNGDGTFQAPVTTLTNNQTGGIAAADFNGDGNQDMAMLYPQTNMVAVFLGNGDGTFKAGATYATGTDPAFITSADFNGDGKADLAIANSTSNNVSILLGNGDGTFQPQVTYSMSAVLFGSFGGIAAGDFNGDGKLDLAVSGTGAVSVFLGKGEGSFQPSVTYGTFLGTRPGGNVVTGDFNRDGKLDLAVADGTSGSLLLGNGDGTFQPAKVISPAFLETLSFVAGDVNGDGKLDLTGTIGGVEYELGDFVLLGNGDGTFQSPTGLPLTYPSLTVVGDFNGDGALDLADQGVEVLLSTPVIGLSAASVNFAGQGVGTTGTQTLTVSNPGSAPITISSIAATGTGFAETNNCSSTLATTSSCAVSITFSPTATGTVNGTLTLTDNVAGSPQTVVLSGSGVSGPFATLTPSALYFATQTVATTSAAQSVTLANTGNQPLTITAITLSGDYGGTNNCPASLAAESRCSLTVTFTPTTIGNRVGSVTINDNAGGSPQTVHFAGTGTAPVVVIAPASLTFASQNQGSTSAAQSVTLTNTGNATLTISSIVASGDFATTNTCGTSVALGATCTVSVTFTPTAPGARTGSITITDNAVPATQTVSLTGTGVAVPLVSFSPAKLSFTAQEVGTASPIQKVTLTNTGSAALSITSITASGDFSTPTTLVNPCKGSVAAGTSCTISVSFEPKTAGALSGSVTVADNAAGSPQSVSLTGTGTQPAVALAPGSLSFAGEVTGRSSVASAVSLTNTGGAPLAISNISFSGTNGGDFTQQNNCGSSVPAGASCTISVSFKPAAGGSRSAKLTVTDNAPGSPQTVTLTGTGNDFTLGVPSGSSSSATITAGQSATYKLSAGAAGDLSGTVSVACSGSPAEANCTVTPSSVPVGAGVVSSPITVVVSTTAPGGVAVPGAISRWPRIPPANRRSSPLPSLIGLAMLLAFATLACLRRDARPSRERARRLHWSLILALVVLLASLAAAMPACGGGGTTITTQSGTPPGAYTITVTGSYTSGSVTLQHGTSLTLTVQ